MKIDTAKERERLARIQFSTLPENLLRDCGRYLDLIEEQEVEIKRLNSALEIAANRLNACSVHAEALDLKLYVKFGEWADEARSALTKRELVKWNKFFKGNERGGAWIYTHPDSKRAIVENHYGITYAGRQYSTLEAAKRAALERKS